uniref:Uncharacterized protein n=1 Tax=Aegilops tauschii subsp. strangulata TaxID=200361 RepID=A0A453MW91_AEGTS
ILYHLLMIIYCNCSPRASQRSSLRPLAFLWTTAARTGRLRVCSPSW